jgi:hypothetical protein
MMLIGLQLPASADVGVSVEFSDDEVRIIGAWYEEHGSHAGQGGGKHKHKSRCRRGLQNSSYPMAWFMPCRRRPGATNESSWTARFCWLK